jgi:hypothetical protein
MSIAIAYHYLFLIGKDPPPILCAIFLLAKSFDFFYISVSKK